MTQTVVPTLIQEMMQPEFYPHPVKEPIQLMQTHISYVFLTGDYAYKVKKPVNFGFLDFSTLEARQHFCLEEIQMNQQNAPEIYLEVLPITQSDDQFELGGTGQTVEYVLKMREFPQDDLFISMFEQGRLTEAHMEELGRIVAQFHAKAQTNDYIRRFGEVSQVRQAIDENYEQTENYIGGPQTSQQFEETKQFTDAFFAKKQELFNSRIQNNKIRECHGDLHLRNICLWQDKIQLFDRIEFNEPFRFVDVMYDIAFAVMDLEARGQKDLGNAFLNTYIEQTGDWEGLQVLPLYLSRQAYVRAKVTSFLLDDPGVPEDAKKEATATAADYYRLAWQYTRQRKGQVILMSGLSGSGKTTVARHLARRLGAIHLRSDAVRKHLAGIPLEQTGGAEVYTSAMNQKTYDRLLELGIKLASIGFPVILDAKYDREAFRTEAIAQAQHNQLPVQIIYCTAPEDVLRDRLLSRTADVSDATANLLSQQQATAELFTDAEQPLVTTVDTTQDWASQLLFLSPL
jgi:aminoglycoside phosphotransferase family enzyme/adenylate kinase family enzyme